MDKEKDIMNVDKDLVRYSRAGDVFHYRWAARRCLKMIHPTSTINLITIEASKESAKAGEFVIDVGEYSKDSVCDVKRINYFQLKHTTKRKEIPFNLSDLRTTIEGFSKRYVAHSDNDNKQSKHSFNIITNRPISVNFKQNIKAIAQGRKVGKRFQKTLEKYTNLKIRKLRNFCQMLIFSDGEGDYNSQRYELHKEMAQLISGQIDSPQIDSITAFVQEKALPDSDGHIIREDILKLFGVTTERDLFPAPSAFETFDNYFRREQHDIVLSAIQNSQHPVIIHASGGVGKTVFANQLAESLPDGSFGYVYDCFGRGKYRNRSHPRHRHRDALVQIINELSTQGLCDPVIAQSTALNDDLLRKFHDRIKTVINNLKKIDRTPFLYIFIDAADNAEDAANDFNESCFVHELIRETMPEGCRIIFLCRTERIHLLQPSIAIKQIELNPFSDKETLRHLKLWFPYAKQTDGTEFHRLTNGNPRVQANVLNKGFKPINEMFNYLGPYPKTVADQINEQLEQSIEQIKDLYPLDFQRKIDAICLGLANLQPFIPIIVLAKSAKVAESTVKSFIADLGRPLWFTDTFVQFRDEPTETWFRAQYAATQEQIKEYVEILMPLANQIPYVAETLPILLLNAGMYNELIKLSLSDQYLPQNDPLNERSIRIQRLQFAFKAALKEKRIVDASKIALRVGEEMAGNERQYELLKKNIDLIAPLQSCQKVQELAFKRLLRSKWEGSENLYTATLLSTVTEYKGEASSYLRAADYWLHIYFDERRENSDRRNDNDVTDTDIIEMTYTYYNLFGIEKAVKFIMSWKPDHVIYRITFGLCTKLIDLGFISAAVEMAKLNVRKQHFIIAITHALFEVGIILEREALSTCLTLLTCSSIRIKRPENSYNNTILSSLISFLEVCAARDLSSDFIIRVLNHYFPSKALNSYQNDYNQIGRRTYLRSIVLKNLLQENNRIDIDDIIYGRKSTQKKKVKSYEDRELKEVIGGLLPWYQARLKALINNSINLTELIETAEEESKVNTQQRWKQYDFLPYSINNVKLEILKFSTGNTLTEIKSFYDQAFKNDIRVRITDLLVALRYSTRLEHLKSLRSNFERKLNDLIYSLKDVTPNEKADYLIDLARAVLPNSHEDAACYFDDAVRILSKSGDEIYSRWLAVTALANKASENNEIEDELAYRLFRSAEFVGNQIGTEKYWDRDDAIIACAKLSLGVAVSSLSRWRDRDVGRPEQQLISLILELVKEGKITSLVTWSFSAFFDEWQFIDFVSLCIEKEPINDNKQYILDNTVKDLRLKEASAKNWDRLSDIAAKSSLTNNELESIKNHYISKTSILKDEPIIPFAYKNNDNKHTIDWNELLNDLVLHTDIGLNEAFNKFNELSSKYGNHDLFWQEIFSRIDDNNRNNFLKQIVTIERADEYDVKRGISHIPDEWFEKISIRRSWGKVLKAYAKRFASKLISNYRMDFFKQYDHIDNTIIDKVNKGILEGLSEIENLYGSIFFFNFVRFFVNKLSTKEAHDLLDYSLDRLELQIEENYCDGDWSNDLLPPDNVSDIITGYIWSALGSPRAKTRWQATHCVRRLGEIGCQSEIDSLMNWIDKDAVGSFGDPKLPFYNLHARLYLLIALARVSMDHSDILVKHSKVFYKNALNTEPHVLIQKFSAEIAINIERNSPGTYSKKILKELKQVNKSKFPIKEIDSNKLIDSPWHKKKLIDKSLKFHHGYDFDRYWFGPLSNVFGVSEKQVEELSTEIIVKEWAINNDGSYKNDPRSNLWRNTRGGKETWHTHSGYPQADDYSFYLSYHSMLVTAGKFLQVMPIIKKHEWNDNEWEEWLSRHLLTRKDGKWLADRRDPTPLSHLTWRPDQDTEKWLNGLEKSHFLKSLTFTKNNTQWITISGSWSIGDISCYEDFHIVSALVSTETSQALLNALISTSNPYNYRIPKYQDHEGEINISPFDLKGWINYESPDICLDEYDPFAAKISYPPYTIGKSIAEKLNITADDEFRFWSKKSNGKPCVISETWGSDISEYDQEQLKSGMRIYASLDFLKEVCKIMDKDIIFKVQIGRNKKRRYYGSSNKDSGYKAPETKVFLFSKNGVLRDA